jgi:hypothetical protein
MKVTYPQCKGSMQLGTLETILARIQEYVDIGVEKFITYFVSRDKRTLEIMP